MSGQTTHLDPEVLADFRAGLITGRRGATLSSHLAECDRCTALDRDLAEVSALLAAVPPPTVPADLANRLDVVLAAEVATRQDHPERAAVSRSRSRRTGGWWPRLVPIRVLAPAAAVILAGVGYGLSQIGGTSPVPTAAAAPAPMHSAAPAVGAQATQNHSLRAGAETGTSLTLVVSGVNYLPGTLKQQLKAELSAAERQTTQQLASPGTTACALRLTGGAIPVLLQSAHYQGKPATVIVASRASGDKAWVVGAGCSLLDSATLPPGI